jgi:2-methylcitrate dehydratase
MTQAESLAAFVARVGPADLSEQARADLKLRVLDALGCGIGALHAPTMAKLRTAVDCLGGQSMATLLGGGKTAADRAAFYNGALIRYLDFNDSYLAKGETCHPSDNLGAVLAASEYAVRTGAEFLTALALAYQVQCRLSDAAPVRAKGFDHTTQGAYALAAGVSKALGLSVEQTANAIAISGTAYNALRVTRTGKLSNWKGLAYANTALGVVHATFLARCGITGPLEVFEGNKGFQQAIAGPFVIHWEREDLNAVRRTILKKYNAEIHSQSAVEALLELRNSHGLTAATVERIEVEIFDVAYHIIGGGEEGEKQQVRTKEQADHSLPYMLAASLLDGELSFAQYRPERIASGDVQALLRKIVVMPDAAFSSRFPSEMPVRIRAILRDGRTLQIEKSDYDGFHTRPLTWDKVAAKFETLTASGASAGTRRAIMEMVHNLETVRISELTALLAEVGMGRAA